MRAARPLARTAARPVALTAAALAAAALTVAPAAAAPSTQVWADGTFSAAGPVFTYAPALVPAGAQVRVHAIYPGNGSTVATLHVKGLAPDTTYAVHAHVGPCSTSPSTSLGHYQHHAGTGPDFVNDHNELWLGFTTNDAGNGSAQTVVDWQPRAGQAVSLTIHQGGPTRVGCVPVAF